MKRANQVANALAWILKSRRTAYMKEKIVLYKAVVLKTVDYGGEFWCSALEFKKYREPLNRVQRRVLLSMTGAFKTTSYEKQYITTGLISLDLEVWR